MDLKNQYSESQENVYNSTVEDDSATFYGSEQSLLNPSANNKMGTALEQVRYAFPSKNDQSGLHFVPVEANTGNAYLCSTPAYVQWMCKAVVGVVGLVLCILCIYWGLSSISSTKEQFKKTAEEILANLNATIVELEKLPKPPKKYEACDKKFVGGDETEKKWSERYSSLLTTDYMCFLADYCNHNGAFVFDLEGDCKQCRCECYTGWSGPLCNVSSVIYTAAARVASKKNLAESFDRSQTEERSESDSVADTIKVDVNSASPLQPEADIKLYLMTPGDCPGNDIWSLWRKSTTVAECAKACTGDKKCVAFMMNQGKECFPKSKSCTKKDTSNKENIFYDKQVNATEVETAEESGWSAPQPHPYNNTRRYRYGRRL